MEHRHVVVIGPMGAGKTTLASAVAERLGTRLRDSDRDLTRLVGVSGAELAAGHGVERLHRLEAAVLLGALADEVPVVIAAAASVLDDPLCVAALERCAVVVGLTAPLEVLLARLSSGSHRRAVDPEAYAELVARRAAGLNEVADLVLDSTHPVDALVAEVVDLLPVGDA